MSDHTSFDDKTLGVHYRTWRNVIAAGCLGEKEEFDGINPEPIPSPRITGRYHDQNFTQVVQPLQVFYPITLAGGFKEITNANGIKQPIKDAIPEGLKGIVKTATEKKLKVKAVGSGHSFSDVATTSDFLVVTDHLADILERNLLLYPKKLGGPNIRHYPWLRKEVRDGYNSFIDSLERTESGATNSSRKFYGDKKERPGLVEFEAGIKIETLNEELWSRGWSLYNMGTYQGQSFIGAASTSTHGSGHQLPPLPDMIRSMVIVAGNGLVLRIEPQTGITQPGAVPVEKDFVKPVAEGYKELISKKHIFITSENDVDYLVQDDDWFAAALVNVGTFGLVYSVIIEVIPRYYLLETVEFSTWENVRKRLKDQNALLLDDNEASAHELFETKEFVAHFPPHKILGCKEEEEPDLKKILKVSAIRQTTIEINPHPSIDANGNEQRVCRIMRQYRVPDSAFADRWTKQHKGRLADDVEGAKLTLALTRMSLNDAWEKVEHNKNKQDEWYEKNVNLSAVAVLRPVSGNLLEAIGVLLNSEQRIAQVIANAPEEPGCREHYLNRNYRTQFIPLFPGYGVELGFTTRPLENFGNLPGYIAAMDRILELADEHWALGRYMQSSPIALRMVKASNAYLSMQYSDTGEPTCMIELLNQQDTHGGKELFYRYQRELFKYGARPHWGLDLSVTTGNNGLMNEMYPKFPEWLKVYKTLNASGTFNNRFTDRMGLSG